MFLPSRTSRAFFLPEPLLNGPRLFQALRRDLAEGFRAQRAEVAAQVTAIANAIIASRGAG